jgi:hypothetical protein
LPRGPARRDPNFSEPTGFESEAIAKRSRGQGPPTTPRATEPIATSSTPGVWNASARAPPRLGTQAKRPGTARREPATGPMRPHRHTTHVPIHGASRATPDRCRTGRPPTERTASRRTPAQRGGCSPGGRYRRRPWRPPMGGEQRPGAPPPRAPPASLGSSKPREPSRRRRPSCPGPEPPPAST